MLLASHGCTNALPLCTGHDDGHVRVWNLDLCSTLNMKRHTNTVSGLGVCKIDIGAGILGEKLMSCSFDGTVAIWEVRKVGKGPQPVLSEGAGAVNGQAADEVLCLQEGDIRPHMVKRWEAHDGCEVMAILYDPMKQVILTAGSDNLIRVRGFAVSAMLPTPHV